MRNSLHKKFIQAKQPAILYGWNKSIFAESPLEIFIGDSIKKFRQFVKRHKKNLLAGYLSYDLGYKLHNIKKTARDDIKLPLIYFQAFNKWEEFTKEASKTRTTHVSSRTDRSFHTTIKSADYKKSFNKIKHYIKEGDIYQINLTHRLQGKTTIPASKLFLKLIRTNPVQHLAYIEGPNFEILSASPERFIKIENNIIETCPVKGTIPISENPKKLLGSEKEAAELNMITDLLRNDLGKVSAIGTVKVESHRLLQKCPTVWHTFSRIIGKLKKNLSPIDALLSMFPGGSITGCPKKRAMEIIDELEPTTRGVYTGCIVCVHPDYLDSSIAIRTIIKKGQNLYLQVGGGIVADSKLEKEYKETLDKAASFMNILS